MHLTVSLKGNTKVGMSHDCLTLGKGGDMLA